MEIMVFIALTAAAFATIFGYFARSTRRAVMFLSIQALAVGSIELVYLLIDLIVGLQLEALIDFSITFAEWFSAAVVSPLVIYWGMVKTQDVSEGPSVSAQKISVSLVATALAYTILWVFPLFALPAKLDVLPFSIVMFSVSVLSITGRRESLKILVGLNMAETALYPIFAETPLVLIPLMLASMVFVNIAGVFIIKEAYQDYGTMSASEWRLKD